MSKTAKQSQLGKMAIAILGGVALIVGPAAYGHGVLTGQPKHTVLPLIDSAASPTKPKEMQTNPLPNVKVLSAAEYEARPLALIRPSRPLVSLNSH